MGLKTAIDLNTLFINITQPCLLTYTLHSLKWFVLETGADLGIWVLEGENSFFLRKQTLPRKGTKSLARSYQSPHTHSARAWWRPLTNATSFDFTTKWSEYFWLSFVLHEMEFRGNESSVPSPHPISPWASTRFWLSHSLWLWRDSSTRIFPPDQWPIRPTTPDAGTLPRHKMSQQQHPKETV